MDTLLQATPEYSPDKSLLIIDDDANLLKHLKKIFSSNYDVKAVMSAKEAFTTIKLGFIPGVIICDHEMPNQSGSKLLEELSKIIPNATKLLLIKHLETKEILESVNEAKAYSFLFKPFTDIEIIQNVKIAFERFKLYKALNQQKQIIVATKNQIANLTQKKNISENENINLTDDFADLFSKVLDKSESYFYYTPKSTFVKELSGNIADKMGLRIETKQLLAKLSEMLISVYSGLPLELKINEVFDLTDSKDIDKFMRLFKENINKNNNNPRFKKYYDILEQIFEHNDGTGLPNYLTRQDIYREALIIGISNLYHNLVYRIKPEEWQLLQSQKFIIQSIDENMDRHIKAIKFIKNRSDWFTLEVFNTFIKLDESGDCKPLIPISNDLVITF